MGRVLRSCALEPSSGRCAAVTHVLPVEPWRISLNFVQVNHSTTVAESFKYRSDRYDSNLVDLSLYLVPIYITGLPEAWGLGTFPDINQFFTICLDIFRHF